MTFANADTWPRIGIIAVDDDGSTRTLEARMSDHDCFPCWEQTGRFVDHRDGSACVVTCGDGAF